MLAALFMLTACGGSGLVGGRWVANDGSTMEFFRNGTVTFYPDELWLGSHPMELSTTWYTDDGNLTIITERLVRMEYRIERGERYRWTGWSQNPNPQIRDDNLFLGTAFNSFERVQGDEGLYGRWLGRQHGILTDSQSLIFNQDGAGSFRVLGHGGGNFTWELENDYILVTLENIESSADYAIDGSELTIFYRGRTSTYTRVGGN